MMHPEFGERLLSKLSQDLEEISTCEAPAKMFGRMMTMVLAPGKKKK
jgi:translation initiation factor IF-3